MEHNRLRREQVPIIADDVRARLLAMAPGLDGAEGELVIKVFLGKPHPEIKVTTTKG